MDRDDRSLQARGPRGRTIGLPARTTSRTPRGPIRDFITNKGWDDVDIVAQSMGGLSARYFIKTIGTSRVDAYVSLGTPQYGLLRACLLFSSQGGQMCPSRSFLRSLNTGDDTPTGVYWTTIYSRTDDGPCLARADLAGGAASRHFPAAPREVRCCNRGTPRPPASRRRIDLRLSAHRAHGHADPRKHG